MRPAERHLRCAEHRQPKQHENFSSNFRQDLDLKYDHHYSPEEIVAYIYAALYAPTQCSRYAEFLRSEYPRMLISVSRANLAQYHGKGDHAVEFVRYSNEEGALWINKTQHFSPVPVDIWDLHIGGQQVLEKFLRSRGTRKLSLDELNHVAAVADSLAFSIAQEEKIDRAFKMAFSNGG